MRTTPGSSERKACFFRVSELWTSKLIARILAAHRALAARRSDASTCYPPAPSLLDARFLRLASPLLRMTEPPRIELEGEIGAGATGRVWRARLVQACAGLPAGSEVALKRLHPELAGDPDARRAFAAEGEAGAAVAHPGLVRVVHSGVDDAGPYLLTEYVPGQTMEQVLVEQGPLPEPLLRSVAAQLAGGLAALHAAGWIHGDVKPENMRLDARGRAVLLDLGF